MNKVAYKSVDELEHFRFDDCQIDTFAVTENGVELMVEALIVRADNSQNTNYTESYAGTTKIRITDGKLIRCVRDGYKYYDAMMCCSPRFLTTSFPWWRQQSSQRVARGHISSR